MIIMMCWESKKRNKLKEDYEMDQMSIKEYVDPFTGGKGYEAKKTATLSGCRDIDAMVGLDTSLEVSKNYPF